MCKIQGEERNDQSPSNKKKIIKNIFRFFTALLKPKKVTAVEFLLCLPFTYKVSAWNDPGLDFSICHLSSSMMKVCSLMEVQRWLESMKLRPSLLSQFSQDHCDSKKRGPTLTLGEWSVSEWQCLCIYHPVIFFAAITGRPVCWERACLYCWLTFCSAVAFTAQHHFQE